MKNLKKIISAIMLLVIAASSMLSPVYAEQESEDYAQAIELTSQLEIFVNDDFQPKNNITRAETAAIVTRLMGYSYEELPKVDSGYYDVSESHWALPYINMLRVIGIMVGSEDGYFFPDQNVTFDQMVKILMSVAGYGQIAESHGGYPNGYNRLASEHKLFKNVPQKGNSYLTREEAAQLIANALELEVVFLNHSDNNSMQYDTDGTTVLERFMKIYKTEGVIKANSYTRTVGTDEISKGTVEINGAVYGVGNTDADDYLGYYVEAYYKENDEYLVAVLPKKNDVYEISAEDFISYQEHFIFCETKNGRDKKYRISETPDVIFNGEYKENPLDLYFKLTDGKITLIDHDQDGRMDVIKILYSISYFADTVGETGLLLHDLYGQSSVDCKKTEDDQKITIWQDGILTNPTDIEKYDVLDVYPSEIKKDTAGRIFADIEKSKQIRIDITRSQLSGKVTSVGEDVITINGEEYELTGAYEAAIQAGVAAPMISGDEKTYGLNAYGKIAGVLEEIANSTEAYIFVTRAYSDTDDLEDTDSILTLRAFNTVTNEWKRYPCKNKVKLNGIRAKKAADIYEAFTYNPNKKSFGSEFFPQIAKVKWNDEGEITFIDTAYVDTDGEKEKDSLTLDLSGTMYYKNNTLNSDVVIPSGGVTILRIPAEGNLSDRKAAVSTDMEREYKKSTWSPFSADKNYTIDAYNLSDAMSSKLILYYEAPKKFDVSVGYYTQYIMVEKINEKLNDDNEAVYCIQGYANGSPVSYDILSECENDPSALKKGDIILANSPANGIASYKQVLDIDDIQISEGKGEKKNLFSADNYGTGKAYAVMDRCLRAYFETIPTDRNFKANTASCNLGDNTFIMYDVDNHEITSVYPEDIRTYTKTRSDELSDILFMYSTSAGFKGMFVIRK